MKSKAMKRSIRDEQRKDWFDYVLVVFFILIVIITLYPFLNVLAVSLNDPTDTMRNVNFIVPRKFTLGNYRYVFEEENLFAPFFMSVARTVIGTVASLACTAMLAYVLSRKDFIFNKLFTHYFVITMYVSGGLIPSYLLIARTLHLSNSFWVYIIPGLISVYNVILVRSYMETLPVALTEAARLDGASDFVIFAKVILPLCTPTLATVALFIAVGQWNSFMDTYLYAKNLPTLQYELYSIMQQATLKVDSDPNSLIASTSTVTPLSIRMAVTVVATVPIIVVYPFLQKYFVGGVTMGAVKE